MEIEQPGRLYYNGMTNKNSLEELNAHFPLIRHGQQRKRKNWVGDTHTIKLPYKPLEPIWFSYKTEKCKKLYILNFLNTV
jgi:hypothetical protein